MPKFNSIYKHYNTNGELLYVGASQNPFARLKSHELCSSWAADISLVYIERFDSLDDALSAEKQAIQSEGPKFNTAHTKFRKRKKPKCRVDHSDLTDDQLDRMRSIWLAPYLSEMDRKQQCERIADRTLSRGWLHGRWPRSK